MASFVKFELPRLRSLGCFCESCNLGRIHRYGAKVLFEDVSTAFTPGKDYGLTGPNGAGKSTFMKLLTGELDTLLTEIMIYQGSAEKCLTGGDAATGIRISRTEPLAVRTNETCHLLSFQNTLNLSWESFDIAHERLALNPRSLTH